jgi:hypothetical protein
MTLLSARMHDAAPAGIAPDRPADIGAIDTPGAIDPNPGRSGSEPGQEAA